MLPRPEPAEPAGGLGAKGINPRCSGRRWLKARLPDRRGRRRQARAETESHSNGRARSSVCGMLGCEIVGTGCTGHGGFGSGTDSRHFRAASEARRVARHMACTSPFAQNSRSLNFWILPDPVSGNASTTNQCRGVL